MKLLFDENLSPKLSEILTNEYPGSLHVEMIGLRGASDVEIWDYSREHGFAIVSKDSDFRERSFLEGSPPKVILLEVGNSGTQEIVQLMKRSQKRIEVFGRQEESCLILTLRSEAL